MYIHLVLVLQLVFKRHAHNRTIPFSTISETARVAVDQVTRPVFVLSVQRLTALALTLFPCLPPQVELLVMKALALGLVKG